MNSSSHACDIDNFPATIGRPVHQCNNLSASVIFCLNCFPLICNYWVCMPWWFYFVHACVFYCLYAGECMLKKKITWKHVGIMGESKIKPRYISLARLKKNHCWQTDFWQGFTSVIFEFEPHYMKAKFDCGLRLISVSEQAPMFG